MDQRLKRILTLVRRTGDRVIMLDGQSDDAFVIMDLASYETLIRQSQASSVGQDGGNELQKMKDMALWDMAQKSVLPSVEVSKAVETEPVEGIEPEVVVNLNQQSKSIQSEAGEKYYFEEVEDEDKGDQ